MKSMVHTYKRTSYISEFIHSRALVMFGIALSVKGGRTYESHKPQALWDCRQVSQKLLCPWKTLNTKACHAALVSIVLLCEFEACFGVKISVRNANRQN
jgi:hypothetical protein